MDCVGRREGVERMKRGEVGKGGRESRVERERAKKE